MSRSTGTLPSSHEADTPSPAACIAEIEQFASLAARCSWPVLLLGETGSGKTSLARRIHNAGLGVRAPFVRVNCGAVPESLFEREMFGNVRGAYTDAREAREGLVETAAGGTLFLDEVGEIPLQAQCKLLAVLDEQRVRRLGSTRDTPVRIRVVAATNSDLAEQVRRGRFREDLYYRLAVLRFRVPGLRARREELPEMVKDVLSRLAPHSDARVGTKAMVCLARYEWPGNIRELENALRHALAYADGPVIEPRHLPEEVRSGRPLGPQSTAPERSGSAAHRYSAPDDPEEEAVRIRAALQAEGGNRTRTARRLGMSRATLWTKLRYHFGSDTRS
jgi:DNA-binding NtrC family response regulator